MEKVRKFLKSHYPNIDEMLYLEMHQTEIMLFEWDRDIQYQNTKLKEENERLKQFKEKSSSGFFGRVASRQQNEINQLKERVKDYKATLEKMYEGAEYSDSVVIKKCLQLLTLTKNK